ncbi:MAG: hypothetical protein RLZZ156_1698 [Deinococcota bacterium]|jgi:hypothetical protein
MNNNSKELVFQLRLTPQTEQAPSSVWLEGKNQHAPIRFDDFQALVRYLGSLADDGISRGLR